MVRMVQASPKSYVGSRVLTPEADILAMRKSLWEKVSSRSHKPLKIFPFGADSDEVMIYGTVEYEFKAGGKGGLEWAARGTMGVGEEGKVVWKEYIVYLVSLSCCRGTWGIC